jgi:hypothetical protein
MTINHCSLLISPGGMAKADHGRGTKISPLATTGAGSETAGRTVFA